MSSEIEYRHLAVKVDIAEGLRLQQQLAGFTASDRVVWDHEGRRHLVFVEQGSSNDFDTSGKKSRNWRLQFHGRNAIKQAIQYSADAEECLIHLRGRGVKAESYIRHYRDLLEKAPTLDGKYFPRLTFELDPQFANPDADNEYLKQRIDEHPFTDYLRREGLLETKEINFYGKVSIKPVLTIGGNRDVFLASLSWLMVVAGDWIKDHRLFWLRGHQSTGMSTWLNEMHQAQQYKVAA